MDFLIEYGLFLAKALTIVVAIIVVIGALVSAGSKSRAHQSSGSITVTNLSEEIADLKEGITKELLDKDAYKQFQKEKKKQQKESSNTESKSESGDDSGRMFVIDFDGDMQASAVENLREEISAIITIASPADEVLLRLESPGGMVHTYGLAASQLQRLRQHKIKLTIAVDAVAASGGYMMACVGDKITAAPFAIIGSIGVLAQVPNFNRLLKHNRIDFEQHTAGEFKRTLTMFGENSDKGREKFKQELESTHQLFKSFIADNRPSLDVDQVATGEHWYGQEALDLGLVDAIATSDDLILQAADAKAVFKIKYEIKKPLSERLPISIMKGLQSSLVNFWYRGEQNKLFK